MGADVGQFEAKIGSSSWLLIEASLLGRSKSNKQNARQQMKSASCFRNQKPEGMNHGLHICDAFGRILNKNTEAYLNRAL